MAASDAEAGAAKGRGRTVARAYHIRHFPFSGQAYADALAVNVAADDVTAAADSRVAASRSVQFPSTFFPWQMVAAELAAAFHGAVNDPNSRSKDTPAEEGGSESARTSRKYAEVGNADTSEEDASDSTASTLFDGTSSSKIEEDDILSFLQVALGAAVVLAVSTWMLLEQRKALNRARYDRLTDLLGT